MPNTSGDIGSILGVWAHPDDEAYLSAGLMARAADAGRRVVCVTATRGEAGFPPGDTRPPNDRIALREREIAESLAILGVAEHHWLGYREGGCAGVDDREAAAAVAALIDRVRPDVILTFGPDGGTGHPDHVSARRWATLAREQAGPSRTRLLYATKAAGWSHRFRTADPSRFMMIEDFAPETVPEDELAVWYSCDDDAVARKVAALRAQASQVEPVVGFLGSEGFTEFVREEFFRDPRPSDRDTMRRVAGLPLRKG
jgi:LmbE family N-acetylglucosaminyl deacetylase